MRRDDSENVRNGSEVYYQPPRAGTPAAALEQEIQAVFYGMRDGRGRVADKSFYEIAEGNVTPTRVLAKKLLRARLKRMSREQAKQIVRALDRFVEATWDDGSEFGSR